jgi:tetratricopeptide (TPR) repeat protein
MRLRAVVSRAVVGIAVLGATLAGPVAPGEPGAWAAEDSFGKLRAAGMKAYNAGDYAEAKKAFDEAFKLSPLHSVGLWAARSRVKLGEWVEADEQLERIAKAPIQHGDRSAEEEARQQAVREREQLRHRLPRLRIRLEGVGVDEVEVAIDGVPVASDFLLVQKKEKEQQSIFRNGKSLVVNPGDHRIVGISGEQRKEVSISVNEGQTRDVNLRFINPDTIRQRKCADKCKADCSSNRCYVDCKHKCFTDHD